MVVKMLVLTDLQLSGISQVTFVRSVNCSSWLAHFTLPNAESPRRMDISYFFGPGDPECCSILVIMIASEYAKRRFEQ